MAQVIYQDPNGLEYEEFRQTYGNLIKDKDIIYVVQSNLEQDIRIIDRATRANKDGVIVKVGKSEGNGIPRLKSYADAYGTRTTTFNQSGVRVLYVKIFPKRALLTSGKKLVQRVETALIRELTNQGRNVGRGRERFRIKPEVLFDLINSIEPDNESEDLRVSDRLGIRLLWLIKDAVTGRLTLEKHPEFEQLLSMYYEQQGISNAKDKSKEAIKSMITAGLIRPQVVQSASVSTTLNVGLPPNASEIINFYNDDSSYQIPSQERTPASTTESGERYPSPPISNINELLGLDSEDTTSTEFRNRQIFGRAIQREAQQAESRERNLFDREVRNPASRQYLFEQMTGPLRRADRRSRRNEERERNYDREVRSSGSRQYLFNQTIQPLREQSRLSREEEATSPSRR